MLGLVVELHLSEVFDQGISLYLQIIVFYFRVVHDWVVAVSDIKIEIVWSLVMFVLHVREDIIPRLGVLNML